MAFCGNCGMEIPDGMKFCTNCGTAVTSTSSLTPDGVSQVDDVAEQYQPVRHHTVHPARAMYIEPERMPKKPVTWIDRYGKFFGIVLMILGILDLFSDPAIVTIILSAAIISGSIFCLARKFKLKGFTIVALVLGIFCLIAGVYQAKKVELLKKPTDSDYKSAVSEDVKDSGISVENNTSVNESVKPDKEVTYGGIIFTIPGKYMENVTNFSEEDAYETKDGTAAFDIAVNEGVVNGSDFKSDKSKSIFETKFKDFIGEHVSNPELKTSNYRTVAGKDCLLLQYDATMDGNDVTCGMAVINDEDDNKIVAVMNIYYDKMAGEYSKDFDILLNGAKPVSGSVSSSESIGDEDDSADNTSADGVDPKLKAALDEYEAFMNEYVDFMNKYTSDPNNALSMIGDYADMMSRYASFADKIDNMDTSNMSKADYAYYLDTINRVEKKLLDVIQ